jgi:hypothetical protein
LTGLATPTERWDSREALDDFAQANREGIEKLRVGLPGSVAWVEFIADSSGGRLSRLGRGGQHQIVVHLADAHMEAKQCWCDDGDDGPIAAAVPAS